MTSASPPRARPSASSAHVSTAFESTVGQPWPDRIAAALRALELAEKIAAFPQGTMLADRRAAIEGTGLPLAEGLALEHRLGRETLEVAARGAARFAAGAGRHGEGA